MIYILRLDYSLSCWLASSKNRVEDLTVLLFLNKAIFILVSLLVSFRSFISVNSEYRYLFVIVIGLSATSFIYALQPRVKKMIRKFGIKNDYNIITKKIIRQRKVLAIFIFILSFFLIFFCAIIFPSESIFM